MQNNKKSSSSIFDKTIQIARPFLPFIPEVKSPLKALSLNDKLIWTIIAVLIYSIASQVPLFGIVNTQNKDPIAWLRVMMASNRGTLMDLGIGPVVTSSMFMNFFVTTGLVVVNNKIQEDRILFDCLQKLFTIFLTVLQAIIQIQTGFYGPSEHIPLQFKIIIFIQLLFSGLIIILLDEMLQKGYGYGNGVNLFIVANVCERLIWSAFSPRVFYTGRGMEFEGCLISLVYAILARRNLLAVKEVFFRENLPNLLQFIYTLGIFSFVVFIQQLRVNLNIYSVKAKGLKEFYPIPLLYTSSSPVILQGQLYVHFCSISRLLFSKFPTNKFIKFLGVWELKFKEGNVPVSGISYYLTAPNSLISGFKKPIHFLIYLFLTLSLAALLSKNWTDNQGESAEKINEKFKDQDIKLKGVRDCNTLEKLQEYVPIASVLSGLITSLVMIFCDITSTIGSGTNMFLAASIINQYVKLVFKEVAQMSGQTILE